MTYTETGFLTIEQTINYFNEVIMKQEIIPSDSLRSVEVADATEKSDQDESEETSSEKTYDDDETKSANRKEQLDALETTPPNDSLCSVKVADATEKSDQDESEETSSEKIDDDDKTESANRKEQLDALEITPPNDSLRSVEVAESHKKFWTLNKKISVAILILFAIATSCFVAFKYLNLFDNATYFLFKPYVGIPILVFTITISLIIFFMCNPDSNSNRAKDLTNTNSNSVCKKPTDKILDVQPEIIKLDNELQPEQS